MSKQKNKQKKLEPITISTQLPPQEIDDIRDLCELTGHKMAYILRVLVRTGAEELQGIGELKSRKVISERGAL